MTVTMLIEVLYGDPFSRIRIVFHSDAQFLQGVDPPPNNLTSPWVVIPPTLQAVLLEIVGDGRFFTYGVEDSVIRTRLREDVVPRIPPLSTMEDELFEMSTEDMSTTDVLLV